MRHPVVFDCRWPLTRTVGPFLDNLQNRVPYVPVLEREKDRQRKTEMGWQNIFGTCVCGCQNEEQNLFSVDNKSVTFYFIFILLFLSDSMVESP